MKILLMSMFLCVLSACCSRTPSSIEYRQVVVTPQYRNITIVNEEPIDVTTTAIDYY